MTFPDALHRRGPQLVLPLRRLAPGQVPRQVVPAPTLAPVSASLERWLTCVRQTAEACLLLDGTGRVAAVSDAAAVLLDGPGDAVGRPLADVVTALDFTAAGTPDPVPEQALVPLRALRTGALARGLLRLRRPDGGVATYDVVAVPLADLGGALAFLQPV